LYIDIYTLNMTILFISVTYNMSNLYFIVTNLTMTYPYHYIYPNKGKLTKACGLGGLFNAHSILP